MATVESLVSRGFLRKVWQEEIRPRLRSARLRDLYLPQDPLQFAAYEWGLSQLIDRLSEDVVSGAYTPDPAHIVRGAKSKGLSRPLAFLSPRDALLYKGIIVGAEAELEAMMSDRVGATMKDRARQRQAADRVGLEYGDWFSVWLSKQGLIKAFIEDHPYIVESDIANYFASVDLRIVLEHLHSRTGLERDVVRLCGFLLDQVMRHPTYADAPSLGIPQEPFDASRTIGHTLLADVDAVLEDRDIDYSRFMDDVVMAADDPADAHKKISIFQRALEPLGLSPNTAKTRVVSSTQYLIDIMAKENAWLDEVEEEVTKRERGSLRVIAGLPEDLVTEIHDAVNAHRERDPNDRPQRWLQVLQRYYTLLRRVGDSILLDHAVDDARENPSAVRTLLEYCRAFPLSMDLVQKLFAFSQEIASVCDDLPLLVLETIGNSPTPAEGDELGKGIGAKSLQLLALPRSGGRDDVARDRLAAAAIPLIAKFGTFEQRASFSEDIWPRLPQKSLSRLQGLVMMITEGRLNAVDVNTTIPGLSWSDVIAIEFLRALEAGDQKATGVALGLLEPQPRLQPNRYHIHARVLMMLGILKASVPMRVVQSIPRFLTQLEKNPERLRDHRAERLLANAMT